MTLYTEQEYVDKAIARTESYRALQRALDKARCHNAIIDGKVHWATDYGERMYMKAVNAMFTRCSCVNYLDGHCDIAKFEKAVEKYQRKYFVRYEGDTEDWKRYAAEA